MNVRVQFGVLWHFHVRVNEINNFLPRSKEKENGTKREQQISYDFMDTAHIEGVTPY